MRIKRFTAKDLPTAMNMIKDEFGLLAIILSQRELPEGGAEVTAGVRDEDLPPAAAPEAPAEAVAPRPRPRTGPAQGAMAYKKSVQPSAAAPAGPDLKKELDEMGGRLEHSLGELKDLILDLAHRQSLSEKWRDRADLVNLYRRLVAGDVAPEHARSLVEQSAESAQAWGGDLLEHLRKTMQPRLRLVDMSLNPVKFLALAGPSGVGKTAALVNLAAFYRQRGRKAAAISLDTFRLGAAEQLTHYARVMGLGLRVCQTMEEFKEAKELFEGEDLVLIDTPSRDFQTKEGRQSLGEYFRDASASVLLVLAAGSKEADLSAALAKAADWPMSGLVLTKFDETENLGGLVGFIMSKAPELAFFSAGPKTDAFSMAGVDKFFSLWSMA